MIPDTLGREHFGDFSESTMESLLSYGFSYSSNPALFPGPIFVGSSPTYVRYCSTSRYHSWGTRTFTQSEIYGKAWKWLRYPHYQLFLKSTKVCYSDLQGYKILMVFKETVALICFTPILYRNEVWISRKIGEGNIAEWIMYKEKNPWGFVHRRELMEEEGTFPSGIQLLKRCTQSVNKLTPMLL